MKMKKTNRNGMGWGEERSPRRRETVQRDKRDGGKLIMFRERE